MKQVPVFDRELTWSEKRLCADLELSAYSFAADCLEIDGTMLHHWLTAALDHWVLESAFEELAALKDAARSVQDMGLGWMAIKTVLGDDEASGTTHGAG